MGVEVFGITAALLALVVGCVSLAKIVDSDWQAAWVVVGTASWALMFGMFVLVGTGSPRAASGATAGSIPLAAISPIGSVRASDQ